jgi:hypothetical protein
MTTSDIDVTTCFLPVEHVLCNQSEFCNQSERRRGRPTDPIQKRNPAAGGLIRSDQNVFGQSEFRCEGVDGPDEPGHDSDMV